MRSRVLSTSAAFAVALVGVTPLAAHADPSAPTPTGSATVQVTVSDQGLSKDQIASQVAQANKLRDTLVKSNKDVAARVKALEATSAKANKALEEYSRAQSAERTARNEASEMRKKSAEMEKQLQADRKELRGWAFQAYAGGGDLAQTAAAIDSIGQDASKAGNAAGDLEYMTESRVRTFQRIRELTEEQRRVTAKAVEAEAEAVKQAKTAAAKKAAADAIVSRQEKEISATRATIRTSLAAGGKVSGTLLGSGDAQAQAASDALKAAMKEVGASVVQQEAAQGKAAIKAGGPTCSNDNATYPNGQIPSSGLCPIYNGSGEALRPKAAAAFNAMSKAYEKETGSPICITDSYRSYGDQVAVKASRGFWAATPGTSNHGFGLALDLCGGINSFGTAAHAWMKQNAPAYGWFHPAWAEPGGALPEPWHWEYAG
ncbi:MAG: D-alanyl-D-alanine carboxypeptidase family protein [Micrococcales bacterium]|nr:D-alanyl-D-alanine carboxypeptidase family protein [Micrococcales bacterium]